MWGTKRFITATVVAIIIITKLYTYIYIYIYIKDTRSKIEYLWNNLGIFSLLTSEQRAIEDAIVAFEFRDKDFLRTRFMAEAFLPFSEIPDTEPESNFATLEQVHLKLSRPMKKSTYNYGIK